MSDDRIWITGDALHTLIELGGLHVGSEVLIRTDGTWNLCPEMDGNVLIVAGLNGCGTDSPRRPRVSESRIAWVRGHTCVTRRHTSDFSWEIAAKHIKAWRAAPALMAPAPKR